MYEVFCYSRVSSSSLRAYGLGALSTWTGKLAEDQPTSMSDENYDPLSGNLYAAPFMRHVTCSEHSHTIFTNHGPPTKLTLLEIESLHFNDQASWGFMLV